MDSANFTILRDYLKAKGFTFATGFHTRPNSNTVLISVPESAVGKTASTGLTSWRQLTSLQGQVASDLEIAVEFLLVRDSLQNQIESGLNGLLVSKFPKIIKEAFLSFNLDGVYDVWLEFAGGAESDSESKAAIRAAVEKYFSVFNVKLGFLKTADGFDVPSLIQILRVAKRLSPVKPDALFEALRGADLKVPSILWIERKLDNLRKQKLIIRTTDGSYALTEAGLATVPHDRPHLLCKLGRKNPLKHARPRRKRRTQVQRNP